MEAMVAAGILGIGLMGLVKLHIASMSGMVQSRDLTRAHSVAAQIGERVAAQITGNAALEELVGCVENDPEVPVGEPYQPVGCRAGGNMDAPYSDPRPGCTQTFDNAPVPSAMDGAPVEGSEYRVDTVVWPHPSQPDSQVMFVFVCWEDTRGYIHEVQLRRPITGV